MRQSNLVMISVRSVLLTNQWIADSDEPLLKFIGMLKYYRFVFWCYGNLEKQIFLKQIWNGGVSTSSTKSAQKTSKISAWTEAEMKSYINHPDNFHLKAPFDLRVVGKYQHILIWYLTKFQISKSTFICKMSNQTNPNHVRFLF